MPVDKLSIEQFAQRVKAKYPQYKDVNDTELVNKLTAKYPEYKQKIKYDQPSQQSAPVEFKPMTDWLTVPNSYSPIDKDAVVGETNDRASKIVDASQRVSNHVSDIDNSVKNLIYDYKKEMEGRVKSQQLGVQKTLEAAPNNFQAQELDRKNKKETYVSPVEIESYKEGMTKDIGMLRNALDQKVKDLSKSHPSEANKLKADIYRLDSKERTNDKKIEKNIEGMQSGDVDYDIKNGIVFRPHGFFGSLALGYKQKKQLFEDYGVFKNTDDESSIIKNLNNRLKAHDPDEPIDIPSGTSGEAGAMLGGQPLKPILGGAIAGYLGTPQAGAAAAAAISAPEMYKLGYAAALPKNYAEIKRKNPQMSDSEAYHRARDLSEKQATVEGAAGAAMGLVGAKVAFKPTGVATPLLQNSVRSALKQIGQEGAKKLIEGVGVGTIGAGGQVIKNLMAKRAGINTDETEGVADQLVSGVAMTTGLAILAKSPKLLKSSTYRELLYSVSKMPDEAIGQEFNNLQETGVISQDELKSAQEAIRKQKEVSGGIPDNIPETDKLKISNEIHERNDLKEQLETKDEAYHPDIKEKVKTANQNIVDISKGAERGDLQKLVTKEINAGNVHESAADILRHGSEKEIEGYMKDVASFAHDPATSALAESTFGKEIVGKAKELYPKEGESGAGKLPPEKVGVVEVSEHGEDTKTAAAEENGTKPSDLTEDGMKEAKELGKYIADNNKHWIVSSEVERAKQTASVAAKEAKKIGGKDVRVENNKVLNTWDIGEFDGKPEGSFSEKDWIEKPNDAPSGGESFNYFTQRMEKAYKFIKSLPDDYHVISHSKVMRALDALGKTDGQWTEETTNTFLKNKELSDATRVRSDEGQVQQGGAELRSGSDQGGKNIQLDEGQTSEHGKTEQQAGGGSEGQTSGEEKVNPYPGKSDLPFGEDIGIAHEYREMRAYHTGEKAPVRGEVMSPREYVERGRRLIADGLDPKEIADDFKKRGTLGVDYISVVRAENERLARATNKAADTYGVDSPQDRAARAAESKWYNEVVKPMQTVWAAMGREQQGVTDIDTGTFTGMRRYFEQENGKPMTEQQATHASELSKKVKALTAEVDNLKTKLTETLDKAVTEDTGKPPKTAKEKLDQLAELIRKGKTNRPGQFSAATPASLVWDGALEVMAKTVEVGGSVIQAVADGIDHIRNSDWYKSLNADGQNAVEKSFREYFKADDVFTKFVDKRDNKFSPEEAKQIWDYSKDAYLNRGADFEHMINGTAKDLGLTNEQVRHALSSPKGARNITNEMYAKQYHQQQAINLAKQWVQSANTPRLIKWVKFIPHLFFRLKTVGHGTVGAITHAGMNIFRPSSWKAYWPNFVKQFKFAFGSLSKSGLADYQKAMNDLVNDPEFGFWKRAGLAIDPSEKYDDYQTFDKLLGPLGKIGDRGFNALKTMRLDMAKAEFNRLSNLEKADPDTIKQIAKIINHATGTSKVPVPEAFNTAFFAPRLEASRWARLVGQPVKAVATLLNWKNATIADKAAAKIVAKRSGEIVAMYVGALAANQGILSAVGSKKQINFLHPSDPDWLKFKMGDKNVDVSGGMVSAIGFLGRLIRTSVESEDELHGKSRRDAVGNALVQYGRGKLSPFASTVYDFATQHDYGGNTMPFSEDRPLSRYAHYLDWKEYILNQQTPIPIAEALKDAAEQMEERGMDKADVNTWMGAIFVGVMSGGTGVRITQIKGEDQNESGKTITQKEK